jgi:DNA-binding GntR family transcriptional regulator
VAPVSLREVFDDHKALTDSLRRGDANATGAAITEHANQVRSALGAFLAAAPDRDAVSGVSAGAGI